MLVKAGGERFQPVELLAAARDRDEPRGARRAALAKHAADHVAIEVGQADVATNNVWLDPARLLASSLTRMRAHHVIAVLHEQHAQRLRGIAIVLHHKNPFHRPLIMGAQAMIAYRAMRARYVEVSGFRGGAPATGI